MEKDMTTGSPAWAIFHFVLPVFVGNKALAAVGSTGTIMFLIITSLIGMTVGFTVLTSQRFGAGDMDGMRKTVGCAAILSVIVSVVATAVSMLGMRSLLTIMNTPADIFDDAYAYIMIICGGIFAQVLYNYLASVLRALGNSRTPLYFLILAALLNIVLDLVFIIQFHAGAAGAAYATVISQGVSGVLCLLYIWKKVPVLHLKRSDWRLDWHIAKLQLGLGLPMALQYSITAIGTIMVQSALNSLGSTLVAAFTAASKIEQVVTQAYVALGTAMATFCAQNMGAGKISRIRRGFRDATLMGIVYSLFAALLVVTVGKYMTYLFISEEIETILPSVDIYLKCVAAFFIPLTVVNLYRNGLQGMGFGFLPMMAGVAELVGRGVTAVIAAGYGSYFGICMASPMAWVLAGGLLILMYFYIMKQYPGDLTQITE